MVCKRKIFDLPAEDLPKRWYNIIPELPSNFPAPRDPEQGPSRLKSLKEIFTKNALEQEKLKEKHFKIPEEVRELYIHSGRPRPLIRAIGLEEKLDTPAKLYYKAEFESPTGSHKVNTAIAQAYYAKKEGVERLTTETGAGQWGTALAYAASLVGLDVTVYWVRAASSWKEDRRNLMNLYGAEVHDSPSENTEIGKKILNDKSGHEGSLGIAISEAIEEAKKDKKTAYSLGSVLNHVLLHQTIIGLEAKNQFEMADDYPDTVLSCVGGGSNFGGLAIPFIADRLNNEYNTVQKKTPGRSD